MKMNKRCFSLFLIVLPFLVKTQSVMNQKTEIAYYLKIYNRTYDNSSVFKSWLEKFDPNYSKYKSNEFTYNEKLNSVKDEISKLIQETSFSTIWFGTKENVKFENYNFSTGEFEFLPITYKGVKSIEESQSYALNNNNYFFNNARIKEADFHSTDIYVINHKDFVGMKMEHEKAKILMEKRTSSNNNGTKVNRNVFIKYFYSIINKKNIYFDNWTKKEKDLGLYCYMYKMEIWGDECMKKDKIADIYAKSKPPSELAENNAKIESILTQHINNRLIIYDDWIPLINSKIINKQSRDCNNEFDFEIHSKITKKENDLFNIKFKIKTNACANFAVGQFYTLIDYNRNEYPLLVDDVEVNHIDNFVISSVIINRKTLQMLGNFGIAYLKLEFGKPTISSIKSFKLNIECNSSDFNWIKWNTKKEETNEYWMNDSANEHLTKKIKQILN